MKLSDLLEYSIDYDFDFKIDKNQNFEDEMNFDIELKSNDRKLIIQIPIVLIDNNRNEIEDSCGYCLILNNFFHDHMISSFYSKSNYLNMINILNLFTFCNDFHIDSKNEYFK